MNNDNKFIAQRIRAQYTEPSATALDELKALDKKVRRPALIFAYIFGIIGSLILGTGMCLAMEIIGSNMILGVAVGCVGILMVSINYAIYSAILSARRKKFSAEIIKLSDKIMEE